MAESGGITGRGVLIDYAEWAARNAIQTEALESRIISLEHLQAVIEEHNIEIRRGDIVFFRTGFTKAYNELDKAARKAMPSRPEPDFAGVEATEALLRWLWKLQPAAVAGDAPSFERSPIAGAHADPNFRLHEWLLAGWGMPIGEMFDLEALSRHCKEIRRYTFFVASMPLKVSSILRLRFLLETDRVRRFQEALLARLTLWQSSELLVKAW